MSKMEQYTLEDDVTLPHESCYVERYGESEGAEGNISCRDFIFPVLKLKMYKIWQVLGMQYRSLPTMMLECLSTYYKKHFRGVRKTNTVKARR